MRVHDPVDGAPQLLEVGEREFHGGGDVADPGAAEGLVAAAATRMYVKMFLRAGFSTTQGA
ncbi:MAG: hypothetical protein V3W11_01375 [bacterium]